MEQIAMTQIVEAVAKKTDLPKSKVKQVLDAGIEEIVKELAHGNRVLLKNFGTFKVVRTKERTARNPKTGEDIKVPAKNVVRFSVSKILRESVNSSKKAKAGAKN